MKASPARATAVAVLLALALARAMLTFVPSMWTWGLNIQRFLPPPVAWLPAGLCLIAIHPSIGEPVAAKLARAGDWLMNAVRGEWAVALLAAAMVWVLSDRTWITGDFLLRQVWAESGSLGGAFGQSLPLELMIDGALPRLFGLLLPLDPGIATRAIGAAAAGGLAVAALRLVRAWGLHGAAAITSAGIILFGGYLTAFTGIGKPAAVMCVLAALVVLGSTRLVTTGNGAALLGSALAVALVTHRGALLLIPMWIVALWTAYPREPYRRPPTRLWLAVALPLLSAAAVAPLIVRIARTLDIPRHLLSEPVRNAGVLAAAFAPLHLVDLANLLLFYSPVVTILPWVAGKDARGGGRPEWTLLLVLTASFVPLLLFVHPMQGIIRDLEAFSIVGVSVAMLAAYGIGTALERQSLPASLAPALLLAVCVPCLQWLVHFHEPGWGLERVRALAVEAPQRSDVERARLWDGIAYRAFRLRQWSQAVEAAGYSVRYAPHPRAVMMLAIARTYTGDHRGAESLYVALAERTPDDPLVWVGLGGAALRLGDSVQISRSLDKLRSYGPGSREARFIRRHLSYFPDVWPRSGERLFR